MGGGLGVLAFSVGDGRNARGDPYYTDSEIKISVLVEAWSQRSAAVAELANLPLVNLKSRAWAAVEKLRH